jgi:hypothetical protein
MASEGEKLSQQIIGEQLSGVTFVMDYVQLQFNPPPTINVYTPSTVFSSGGKWTSGDDQFRNMLCGQIGKLVKSVAIQDEEAFRITFEDDSVISISLKPSDYVGPEAVEFIGRDKTGWLVI